MEPTNMGKVLVSAKIENLRDIENRAFGTISADQVRCVDVNDAQIDTAATTLFLPKRLIAHLGLRPLRSRMARGLGEEVSMTMYSSVRLTVKDRDCALDVGEISDEFPVLIGQVPLELLDFVVDPGGQQLIGNPAHGGEQILEVY